ncbi:hypothetical protein V6N13_081224 [Hibiscus sabdariffa]|uniref:Uncharacterized protein n=1 Tax=Hibiscus sabdariffa TaxID=183260 RepID=A0ABR2P9B5_9ROSI
MGHESCGGRRDELRSCSVGLDGSCENGNGVFSVVSFDSRELEVEDYEGSIGELMMSDEKKLPPLLNGGKHEG